MGEHQEHGSNEDLVPELADEVKVQLAEVQDEYETFLKSGETAAADKLVEDCVKDTHLRTAGHRHLATLRLRKAAAAKGLRIGV